MKDYWDISTEDKNEEARKTQEKREKTTKKRRCQRFFAETLRFSDGIYFDP